MKAHRHVGAPVLAAFTLLAGHAWAEAPRVSPAAATAAVRALTPPQMEGPYYPVARPADHDNDLTRIGSGPVATGTLLALSGQVIDQRGRPVPGSTVELWQADGNGIYMHPNDARTEQRDKAFQFFGQSKADGDGRFSFRTVMPGYYGTRPRHLHVKVVQPTGRTLTTQLYFAGDQRLASDFLTRRLGDRLPALLLQTSTRARNELSAEVAFVVE